MTLVAHHHHHHQMIWTIISMMITSNHQLQWTSAQINLDYQDLTKEELKQVFPHHEIVPEYNLFSPHIEYSKIKNIRRRRRRSSADEPTRLQFNALGEMYDFRLTRSSLLSEAFAYIEHTHNSTSLAQPTEGKDWSKYSQVYEGVNEATRSSNPIKIAISLGKNMVGIVKGDGEDLVIRPLPSSIAKRKRRSILNLDSHVIYRRRQNDPCSVKDQDNTRRDTDYLLERGSLYQRFNGRNNNRGPYSSSSSSSSSINSFHTNKYNNNRRYTEDLYIETAVFVDKDLFRHMRTNFPDDTKEQVLQFVLAMVNAVQLLYNDETLGHRIKFVLKRLQILYDDPEGLDRTANIDKFLTNFCNWQSRVNPGTDSHPLHWDHAVILTGLDLHTINPGGKINAQVVGLAPVTGMCLELNSCTVNEGKHFESVFVVTHEFGHNLNMRHDGLQAGNNCDPGRYLMSPTLGSGKITWSDCSRTYLDQFLETRQAECLRDVATPRTQDLNHEWWELPGQRFSADMQCTLKHGQGSYHASQTQSLTDVCEDLHCRRDHYSWTSHPALEGTSCGLSKWCRRGKCVRNSNSAWNSNSHHTASGNKYNEPDDSGSHFSSGGGFSNSPYEGEWGPWSVCKSSCLYGIDGILSSGSIGTSLSERQCRNCKGQYRYRACSAVQECSQVKRKTLQDFADQICSTVAYDDFKFTGKAAHISLSGLIGCEVDCLDTRGNAITSRKSYPDGTVCNSPTKYPAYCVKGMCTEFRCEPESLYGADSNTCRPNIGQTNPHRPIPPYTPSTSTARPSIIQTQISSNSNLNFFRPPSSSSFDGANIDGIWGQWEPTSNCRSSCIEEAIGIQLVVRNCIRDPCIGLDRNIQLCVPTKRNCDKVESSFHYATEVCHKYQREVTQLSGLGMQLASTPDDPDRPCNVACQDADLHYRFYRVNGRGGWFPFGTDCSKEGGSRRAYCLNGKCLEFVEDGTPLRETLPATEDRLSRALPLEGETDTETKLTVLPEDAVQYQSPKTDGTLSLFQRRIDTYNPSSSVRKHWKRNVIGTAHRVPGSFDDKFILTLIEELNATLTSDKSQIAASDSSASIDLSNPLYVDIATVNSTLSQLRRHMTQSGDQAINGRWKVTNTPCSVTCGDGVYEVVVSCELSLRIDRALDSSETDDQLHSHTYCTDNPPATKGYKPCSTGIVCPSEEDQPPGTSTKMSSRVGRWLMAQVDKAMIKHRR